MQISINGIEIFYNRHLGDSPVVLLHGWGASHMAMQGIYDYLCKLGKDVINIDLPGFGQSSVPPQTFGIDDYADCVKQLIIKLGLKDVTLIGHSFGGRICILLGKEEWLKQIVLTASAGIKPKFSLKKYYKIKAYKRAIKRNKDISKFGSVDYKALSGAMRQVFVRVVNRHLSKEAQQIAVPTLLIWGKYDKDTPLYMAKKLKRLIQDSGLVVLEGGHYVYAEKHFEFCNIIKSFLNDK